MEGLNKQIKSNEAEKNLIRERIFAKQRLQASGIKVEFSAEELALIREDIEEDRESRDLSGH